MHFYCDKIHITFSINNYIHNRGQPLPYLVPVDVHYFKRNSAPVSSQSFPIHFSTKPRKWLICVLSFWICLFGIFNIKIIMLYLLFVIVFKNIIIFCNSCYVFNKYFISQGFWEAETEMTLYCNRHVRGNFSGSGRKGWETGRAIAMRSSPELCEGEREQRRITWAEARLQSSL